MGIANGTLVAPPEPQGQVSAPIATPPPTAIPTPAPAAPPARTIPVATVVIPCFNHGRFVSKAVESALAQEGAEISVVVVDDGSSDGDSPGACERCRGERVRVIHQSNRGLPAARNAGARGATSEFLV